MVNNYEVREYGIQRGQGRDEETLLCLRGFEKEEDAKAFAKLRQERAVDGRTIIVVDLALGQRVA